MDQHDDFDSVSWRHDADSDNSRPTTSGTDAEGPQGFGDYDTNGKRRMSSASQEEAHPGVVGVGDGADLAGAGEGTLECEVGSPLKENDGTKDAYVSYLITTHVGGFLSSFSLPALPFPLFVGPSQKMKTLGIDKMDMCVYLSTDRFQDVPEIRLLGPQAVHGLLFLI